MQLKSLRVFVTIVSEGGFTKAAESMFIGQPALSKTIQKMEQDLNVTLFDRTKKKMKLTDEGEVLYEKAKEILLMVEQIPEALHKISVDITGELKIGIPQIIGSVFFPKIADNFLSKYPKVRLHTTEKGGVITEKLVESGELDIGFVVLPTLNTLNVELLYQGEFVVCVSSQHPLASIDKISVSELKEERFILFDKTFALYNLIFNYCMLKGFSPNIAFQSTQWDLVMELVSANLGITIVPKVLTNKLKNIDTKIISITDPNLSWDIGIITNKKAYKSHALRKFIETIHETYLFDL